MDKQGPKRYHIITFGCQMNAHDSERIAGILQSKGLTEVVQPEEADLIVINTCSIRQKAEDKFYSQIGRFRSLKQRKPSLKIAVAGCIAQQEGERITKRAPYVDLVIGPQNIYAIKDISNLQGRVFTEQEVSFLDEYEYPIQRQNPVKALVNIMYGCNNFCSYCIVPYTRGRERSRVSRDILREIKELAQKGYKEVMLLGQNVNSYKDDLDFTELLIKIGEIEGIERVRFMTSHPKDLSDRLIGLFGELRSLCEHIHLPLQSGSDRILGLMNRKYTYQKYLEKILKLRSKVPEIVITTDIITGFPQETERDHQLTLEALKEIRFDGIFSFKYSVRPNTAAANLEGHLPEETKEQRLYEINSVQDIITEEKNKVLEGREVEVMVEEISDKPDFEYMGRTRGNKLVYIKTDKAISYGTFLNVIIKKAYRHSLETEV